MNIVTFLAIGIGGFLGAVLRAYVVGLTNRHIPHDLPFGTLSVNLIGSFIMGLLYAYFTTTEDFPPYLKSFIATGVLGAFTTYSTFAIETVILLNHKSIVMAFGNMALNLFGSVIAAAIGYHIVMLGVKNGGA